MGRVIFSFPSTHALVKDNWKSREIEIYDPSDAPFLDHYRLRVPRYRTILEFLNLALLLILFVLCLTSASVFFFINQFRAQSNICERQRLDEIQYDGNNFCRCEPFH